MADGDNGEPQGAIVPTRDYDVVIVGSRCAGATLATYLVRAGARVLLLDKDRMPSEHVLSTHSINPPGMDVLDEVGVGKAVRALSPPSHILRVNVDGVTIDLEYPEHRSLYCPRRERLDGLLQQAAVAAGAELLDRTRVSSLVREAGRVRGVQVIGGERERRFTAGLVIGADGRHSTVARLVAAEEYLGYDAPRAVYWAYWDAPRLWKEDPAYRFHVYFGFVAGDVRAVFQTDDDQLLIAASPPADRVEAWRADPRGSLLTTLGADPLIAPLIRGSGPDGKVRGTVKERYFFRSGAGNGWALVGDAGHHKEFMLGDGITEALLQARSLAAAIGEGTDAALVRWWRARDVAAIPLHCFGQVACSNRGPDELQRVLMSRLAAAPALKARMVAVVERRLSPFNAMPASQILQWILGAAVRGRWGVLGQIFELGQRAWAVNREMRARIELLAEAVRASGSMQPGESARQPLSRAA